MARIGGRAARWAVGASAAAAAALLATAGVPLTGEDADLRPAAVGAATTFPDAGPPSGADSVSPSGADSVSPSGADSVSPIGASSPSPSAPPPSSTAAGSSVPGTPSSSAVTSPSPAPGTPSSSVPLPPSASAAAAPTPSTAIVSPGPPQPGYPTHPGATADAPFVSFIGDSWTYGTGATGRVGYAHLTGRLLGWTHRVLGVGGSGYVRGGAGDVPFDERILPAVSGNPDIVVVQGSINERSTSVPELGVAVADTLGRLVRAAGPDTTVVVLGASQVPGVPVEHVDKVNDTVRAGAERLGLRFVDVAAETWSDPADPSIWADPYHVNDSGAQRIADRLAPLLRAVVAG